jgi:hypothetical protein
MPPLLLVFSSHFAACVLDRYLHVLCIFHREHPTAVRVSALVERYEVGAMSGGLNEDPIVNMQINRLGSKMSVVVAHRRLSVSTPSSIINNNNDQQWQCGDSHLTKCSSSSFSRAANNPKGPLNPLRPSITPLAQREAILRPPSGPFESRTLLIQLSSGILPIKLSETGRRKHTQKQPRQIHRSRPLTAYEVTNSSTLSRPILRPTLKNTNLVSSISTPQARYARLEDARRHPSLVFRDWTAMAAREREVDSRQSVQCLPGGRHVREIPRGPSSFSTGGDADLMSPILDARGCIASRTQVGERWGSRGGVAVDSVELGTWEDSGWAGARSNLVVWVTLALASAFGVARCRQAWSPREKA